MRPEGLSTRVRYRQLSFERAARRYDAVSGVQQIMARRLTTLLSGDDPVPRHVLELGCGTGHLSELLTSRFPRARFLLTDLSRAMLERSRGRFPAKRARALHWLQLDASQPAWGVKSRFDLVASNAMVQWLDDLDSHLMTVARHLRPGAAYLVGGFGRDNLPELAEALARLDVAPNIGHSQVELARACAAAGLRMAGFRTEHIPREYGGAEEFFDVLRTMGASRYPGDEPLGPGALRRLMRAYAERNRSPRGVWATWSSWYALLRR